MDIYKCPKSISEFTFGNKKIKILYILLIFLLKEQFAPKAREPTVLSNTTTTAYMVTTRSPAKTPGTTRRRRASNQIS